MIKNRFYTFLIVLASVLVFAFPATLGFKDTNTDIIDHEIIYKVKNKNEAYYLAETYHLKLNRISPNGLVTYQLTNDSPLDDLLKIGFSFNTESYILSSPWDTSNEDPYIDQQYALDVMDTIEGWTITEGSNNVLVAVIDTGIDIDHIEFEGRISPLSYNAFTLEVGIDKVNDTHGHGTMVAGIIAANKDNQAGIAGIAPNTNLMVIKANQENEGVFQDSAVIEGIYYATNHGADIINLSLGNLVKNVQMEIAINYAYNHGVIVVAAAGNDGFNEPLYPAAFERSISVSSVDSRLSLAEYSNYGESIDITAPGSDIITTVLNNGYATVSGTSFSAPHITGVLSLMLSHHSNSDYQEIIQRLLKSSNDIGETGKDIYFGHGLVNTYNALSYEFVAVQFDAGSTNDILPIYLPINSRLTLPEDPVLKDHIFTGWYKDDAYTERFDPNIDLVSEDIILYAKFNAEYHTVTFITDGNDVEPLVIYHGNTFELPKSNLDYHIFIGWTIDPENTIPYNGFPIYKDLTLYAHFEAIVYHSVDIYIDGQLYDNVQIENQTKYQPSSYNQTGHIFDGWYIDEFYETLYQSDMPITSDMMIYARFIPIDYNITLFVDGFIYDFFKSPFGKNLSLPELHKDEYLFLGWYYDEGFTQIYHDELVDGDITLYARFSAVAYHVTYVIEGDTRIQWYVPNDEFLPFEPYKEGYTFMGWYYDEDLTEAFIPSDLSDDITLYAYFEINRYNIRFFDFDKETILFETALVAGSTVIPPRASEKPNSISFSYEFIGWSEPLTNIHQDIDIYPIYKRTFIPESIQLNPGVDTITEDQVWFDGGLTKIDDYLYVVVNANIDPQVPGKYTVLYDIYDESQLIITIERIVRVVKKEKNVIIELNPGISTIIVGQNYEDAGVTYNQGELEIISDVNTSKIGIYRVRYQVTVGDTIYEKVRYIHVIDASSNTIIYIYNKKEEDDIYVA